MGKVRNITLLGKYGGLSKGLKFLFNKNNPSYKFKVFLDRNDIDLIKVATYCPTLNGDNYINFEKELKYYSELIDNFKDNEHLVYISSITLELTNSTFYSKAKKKVEEMIKASLENYTILRLGMIFDSEKGIYTLKSMEKSSNSIFTFLNDTPKTTLCTIQDIYESIIKISNNLKFYSGKTLNVGIKRHTFSQLQNISKARRFRIPIFSFSLLKILILISPRLKAYLTGQASLDVPNLALKGSYD